MLRKNIKFIILFLTIFIIGANSFNLFDKLKTGKSLENEEGNKPSYQKSEIANKQNISEDFSWSKLERLINNFVATKKNLTVEEIVNFINQYLPSAQAQSEKGIRFGSKYFFNQVATYGNALSVSALSPTSFVVAYSNKASSYYGTAKIGTVVNDTVSFGPEYVFYQGGTFSISVSALSPTSFVVAYGSNGAARIGTVSGTTISFGSEYVFSSGSLDVSISTLSSNSFVIAYSASTYEDRARIGTVSGTTISFGSEYVFNANGQFISTSIFSSTKFVVAYRDDSNSYYGTARIGTVSGTTISFGSEYVFNQMNTDYISVSVLSSNSFVVAYRGPPTGFSARIGTVSGTTISFGSEYVFGSQSGGLISTSAISSTSFIVSWWESASLSRDVSRIGTVSGTTISFGSDYVFYQWTGGPYNYGIKTFPLSSTSFVIAFVGVSDYGQAVIGLLLDPIYPSEGWFTSTNLLTGVPDVVKINNFTAYASTIPSETSLQVQFSQNNTNWYNSSNVSNGWDYLSQGNNTINLNGLNWSGPNFYYKIKFNSDTFVTPILDEISVNYTSVDCETFTAKVHVERGTKMADDTAIIDLCGNEPPQCQLLHPDKDQIKAGEFVYFTVNALDNDGTIQFWQLDFGDGTPNATATLAEGIYHQYNSRGAYCAKAKVKDNKDAWSDTPICGGHNCAKTITVTANQKPVADIRCHPTGCDGPEETVCKAFTQSNICLKSDNSYDPDADTGDPNYTADRGIISSVWTITAPGQPVYFSTCNEPGNTRCTWVPPVGLSRGYYTAKLEVEDKDGETDIAEKTFTILQDAIAGFMCSRDNENWEYCQGFKALEDEVVYFKDDPSLPDHSTPSDIGTNIISREWTFEDAYYVSGANTTNPTVKFKRQDYDSGTVTLRIADNGGRTAEVSYKLLITLPLPKWKEIAPFRY